MPCNRPRTKNLKRHFTFWPAPFLKAALKAHSRNKRSDAHNYKTVAMGTPRVHSDQSLAWTAMVAPPADLRHGFCAGRPLEADPLVRVVDLSVQLLPSHAVLGEWFPPRSPSTHLCTDRQSRQSWSTEARQQHNKLKQRLFIIDACPYRYAGYRQALSGSRIGKRYAQRRKANKD